MFEMSGGDFGIRSVAKKQIRASGSPNGTAGILIQGKAAESLPAFNLTRAVDHRFFRFDKDQGRRRKYAAIQRDGTSRCQFDVDVAQRTIRLDFKKNVAGIVIEDSRHFIRMMVEIFPDFLHGHFLYGNLLLFYQQGTDAAIRPSVGRLIMDV